MNFPLSNLDFSVSAWPLAVIGLALLGGLILNLMPCVLPVLSIKLMGVVSKGGKNNHEVRLGFLASSAGILFAFSQERRSLQRLPALQSVGVCNSSTHFFS